MPRNFTVTHENSVAVATLDVPGRTMNVIDAAELRDAVEEVLADVSVAGMVIASGKEGSFGGGADLTTPPALASDPGSESFLLATHDLMERMRGAAKPILVAINGYALGGALEVSLGGSTLIASDRTTLGDRPGRGERR
ncbi:hypothetical protein EEB13_15195 [Rhodococcus sp. WS3]|uniref:enoyl-CoA hydratase-related protein n=1 Tax=Rhodococcus sp. WS3 TaxID=2486271 RepID=UPI001143CB68|nr:enoyl-CoA hydratase-related protein [Rhodococcus sp. WS3]ROZ45646.1 hypothetical protein EEB13_15195 [Rhodococcus sp. WS3]